MRREIEHGDTEAASNKYEINDEEFKRLGVYLRAFKIDEEKIMGLKTAFKSEADLNTELKMLNSELGNYGGRSKVSNIEEEKQHLVDRWVDKKLTGDKYSLAG